MAYPTRVWIVRASVEPGGARRDEGHLAAGVPTADECCRGERSLERVGASNRDLEKPLGGLPHQVGADPVAIRRAVGEVTAYHLDSHLGTTALCGDRDDAAMLRHHRQRHVDGLVGPDAV